MAYADKISANFIKSSRSIDIGRFSKNFLEVSFMANTQDKDFIDEVKEAGAQVSIPAKWCEIFAGSLIKVAKKLGIVVEVVPKDKCLWIIIISLEENFAKPSFNDDLRKNLDIVGFDYHSELETFELITVVGFRNCYYNQKLFPYLRRNPHLTVAIEKHYSPCRFDRQIRFNSKAATFYQHIKTYKSLGDYIRDVCNDEIYFNPLTKSECIERLNKFGITESETIDKLNRYRHKEYNWLEYLHIPTEPPINCRSFLDKDPATIAEFERQLEVHLTGMIKIDKIYMSI